MASNGLSLTRRPSFVQDILDLLQSRIVIELRQLTYVDAVATHRHFTRAAAALGTAQPALSHQIKRLEQELGVQLFHRSRAGVRLTDAGEILLPRIRRALSEIAAGREELAAITGLQTGRVRLGAMQALGPLDLPRAIARYHSEHPGIEVTLSEESTSGMQQLILDGQLDLAIAALDVSIPDDLSSLALLSEPVLLAVPDRHPLAGVDYVEVRQLRDDPFVVFRAGTGLRTITERVAREAGFTPKMAFETGNLDRLLALVREGLGVSLIPESTAQRTQPRVRGVPFSPPLTRTVGILSRSDRSLSPSAHAMRQLLLEFGRQTPSRECGEYK
jgi:LysR family transcriptional activator of glutamate synthase operon